MKTLGGRQLWGDVAVFHDWRIQKNILTGHYRLLDEIPSELRGQAVQIRLEGENLRIEKLM